MGAANIFPGDLARERMQIERDQQPLFASHRTVLRDLLFQGGIRSHDHWILEELGADNGALTKSPTFRASSRGAVRFNAETNFTCPSQDVTTRFVRLALLSILSFGLAILAYAHEQPMPSLPDAAAVSLKVGQNVQFRDQVKAVSYSRSTDGYYLSFGAPYPKQVLSVWFPGKVYDHLPARHSMVGRVVRVTGSLEQSPSGPLIKLATSENSFVLEPVDSSALTKPTLDGHQDRTQFEAAVRQTFKQGDYATLETLGMELRESRERLNDGSWLSAAYFAAFGLRPYASMAAYELTQHNLAAWEAAYPASTVLPMIQAGFHLDVAWRWRGNGLAKTVTKDGWAGFRRELASARQILEATPGNKSYPEYYRLMQTVALGESWPKEKYFQLFDEATRIAPDYTPFYTATAYYLMPKWHGRKGEWEAFAEREREQHGVGGAGDGLYAWIVLSMRDEYHDLFHETAASWETTANGLEYLIREHPQSRSLKNLYANLCWKEHDRARLRRALPEIQPDPDMTIWVNLENVALAEKWAGGSR